MNAKIVLAAVAAVCCVQGISAASLVRPLPWVENTDAASDFNLENVDLEEVVESMMMSLTPLDNAGKGERGMIMCKAAIRKVQNALNEDKALFDAFKKDRISYQNAIVACDDEIDSKKQAECVDHVNELHKFQLDRLRGEIVPHICNTFTAVFALRTCLIPF